MIIDIKSILFILSFCILCSCAQNDTPVRTLVPEEAYCTVDGTVISGAKLYCVLFEKDNYSDVDEYYASTKTVSSYSDFFFLIKIEFKNPEFHFTDTDQDNKLQSELYSYLHTKADVIRNDRNYHSKNGDNKGYGMDEFFSAYINGEVEITCDKTLFGLSPGENLVNKLKIIYNYTCQPIGITPPYSVIHCDEIERSIKKSVFHDKAWLRLNYRLTFKDIPEEIYDEITFKLRLPIIKENASHYISSFIKGYESKPQYEEMIYNASVNIIFNH